MQIINIFTKPRVSPEEVAIQNEIIKLRADLKKISMRDNYVEYVKLERQIVIKEEKIQKLRMSMGHQNLIIKYALPYGAQGLLWLTIVVITVYFRKTPVIVFNKEFNFVPFGLIMRYPTSVDNAISVPFWVFISSFVSRTISSYF